MTPARDVSLTDGDQKLGIVQVLPLVPATVYVLSRRLGAAGLSVSFGAPSGTTRRLEAPLRGGGWYE